MPVYSPNMLELWFMLLVTYNAYDYDLVTGFRQRADNDPGGYNTITILITHTHYL